MAVSRSDIVRTSTATAMVDELGLDGVTLRELAGRLGISAPTLYWHVCDKRHLLDLVAEQVRADMSPAERHTPRPGQSVEHWLAEASRQQRVALLAHRDSPRVVAGNRPTEDALPGIEQTLGVLVDAGLEPGEAVQVLTALGSFVIGDALENQSAGVGTDDDRFETGLALLMDGLRARLDRRAAGTHGPQEGHR